MHSFAKFFLLLLPTLVAADFFGDLWLGCYFLFGGTIDQLFAVPKCTQGLERLGLPTSENVCGCGADVETCLQVKGIGGCRSETIFCIEDDLCGDARFDMTFGACGDLDTQKVLTSHFLAYSPAVYDITVVAQPQDTSSFGNCTATVEMDKACQSCSICDDGITFTFNCSNTVITQDNKTVTGPAVSDCLNFLYEKV